MRKIAANLIKTPTSLYPLSVIELEEGYVTRIYPLTKEVANTEWMSGEVELKQVEGGRYEAYYQLKRLR